MNKAVALKQDDMPTSMPIPQTTSSSQLLAVLSRMMSDPSVDIERIERGAALYERALARDAETAFNDAMAAVQLELTPIARDSNNPQTHSKYASYFAVDRAIRPIYTKHGFRLSFDTANDGPENHIRVVAILSRGGHSERYHYDSPIVTTGIQGKAMMTLTHAGASAVTYAKRYLAGMIFNLSTGEDADGNAVTNPISLEQVEELVALADEVGADKEAFCRYFKVGGFADISASDFPRAIAALNKKRGAK